MKYLFGLLAMVILALSFATQTNAAPAPTLFAYNDTTKQCGAFRDGDEYVRYDLPKEWQTYDYQKSIAKTTQAYCDELGYTNIGSVVTYLDLKPITIRERPTTTKKVDPNKLNYWQYTLSLLAFTITALALGFAIHKNLNNSK
jgi:hypothetical protein